MTTGRTYVIGDVHGERQMLTTLMAQLPFIGPDDALVFLGDYVDRGPDSAGVVALLRRLPEQTVGRVVCLQGNHEAALLGTIDKGDPSFVLPPGNGVLATFASFTDQAPVDHLGGLDRAGMDHFFDVGRWLPPPVIGWMRGLPLWWRDPHATYVHAGLEGEGTEWSSPETSSPTSLLRQREPDFFSGYHGPRLIFGHTPVEELPPPAPGRHVPWRRGPLVGLDTGAGKGGPLSCLELPTGAVIQVHPDGRITRDTLALT